MADNDKEIFWNGEWYSWDEIRTKKDLIKEIVEKIALIDSAAAARVLARIEKKL